MAEQKRNVTMDLVRGISALIVCCGHLRMMMFLDFSELDSQTFIERIFYFFTSLGHEAVMVFFVLSGFFVGGSVLNKRFKFRFDSYLIARLSRLWTVLVPALVFTFIMDSITHHYFPAIIAGEYQPILLSGPTETYSAAFSTFLANIGFLQTVYSPVFGSNGPLWSLTNEFWYYITFPLALIAFNTIRFSQLNRIISIIFLTGIAFLFISHLYGGFLIWIFGVIVFTVYSKKLMNLGYWFTMTTFLLFMSSLVYSRLDPFHTIVPYHTDYVVGLAFSLFLISLRNIEKLNWVRKHLSKIAFWLSDISYTLYLTHFPVFMLIYGFFYMDRQVTLNFSTFLQYTGWLALVIVLSRGFWVIFEKNTYVVRNAMFKVKNRLSTYSPGRKSI